MKTKQVLWLTFMGLTTQFIIAQATNVSTTNITTAASYLGSGPTSNFDVQFKRNNVNAGLLSTSASSFGVNSLALLNSVTIGAGAGQFSAGTARDNVFVGQNAGKGASATLTNVGLFNTFIGTNSGMSTSTGNSNCFVGGNSGGSVTTGIGNSFFGSISGGSSINGNYNTYVGYSAGTDNSNGSSNINIGSEA